MRTKTLAIALSAVFTGVSAFAGSAQDDILVTVSTVGPDCYADGQTVNDGEYYALVWVKKGAEFGGFKFDGTLVDNENNYFVSAVPFAKNGCLGSTLFVLNKETFDPLAKTGTFNLYLLDTRSAEGKTDNGKLPGGVIGFVEIASADASNGQIVVSRSQEAGHTIPDGVNVVDVPQPKIVGIDVNSADRKVVIKFENALSPLKYSIASGANPDAVNKAVGTTQTGKSGVVEVEIPMEDGVNFFQVKGSVK